MELYRYPERNTWHSLLRRPAQAQAQLEETVAPILDFVREKGDAALRHYTLNFDRVDVRNVCVEEADFAHARSHVSQKLKNAIHTAANNIERFHAAQADAVLQVETMPGVQCWRKSVAIEKVGLYIPGGTAPLFSTVLMLGVPARIAGCKEVVLCTPPDAAGNIHPAILYAAEHVGIHKVFRVGGVQAIGAMTYGTESIPAVYKIFGPGNQYVTAAKQLVSRGGMAIDMPAGPSEVAVVADSTAKPEFIAADLLSQAEHGADSQVIFITWDERLIEPVNQAIERQLKALPRRHYAEQALEHSRAFLVKDRTEALDMLNAYAAEHLILSISEARAFAEQVVNAGSVFIGNYTPESAGDYASGTNHTLPTYGHAVAWSGVSLDSFVKKITFQEISPEGLLTLGPVIETLAEAEELMAHHNAVRVRLDALKAQQ